MPRKDVPKKNGKAEFVKSWLYGNEVALADAYRKEASREVGEMLRWMEDQIDFDPMGMLWIFSEELFPMINRAKQYRGQIYDRNKKLKQLEFDAIAATHATYAEEEDRDTAMQDLTDQWNVLEAEQMALAWRIKKIHIMVTARVNLELAADEKSPFAEYEYDPEKS